MRMLMEHLKKKKLHLSVQCFNLFAVPCLFWLHQEGINNMSFLLTKARGAKFKYCCLLLRIASPKTAVSIMIKAVKDDFTFPVILLVSPLAMILLSYRFLVCLSVWEADLSERQFCVKSFIISVISCSSTVTHCSIKYNTKWHWWGVM